MVFYRQQRLLIPLTPGKRGQEEIIPSGFGGAYLTTRHAGAGETIP